MSYVGGNWEAVIPGRNVVSGGLEYVMILHKRSWGRVSVPMNDTPFDNPLFISVLQQKISKDTDVINPNIRPKTANDNFVEADNITTFQVKGGGRYNLDDRLSAFANLGYVQKPPILDNVIDYDGNISTNPDNEKFTSFEVGGEYGSDKVAIKGSYYNTQWKDRNLTKSVTTGQGDSGDTDIIYLTGVNQSHSGVEVEAKVALHEMVDLDVAFSKGDWYFDGDARGDYTEMEYNDDNQIIGQTSTEYQYALNNLKVGDMPQTSYVGGLTLKPIDGLRIQGLYKYYDNHYSDWSPDSREVDGDADRAQVWKTPSYGKLDLHLSLIHISEPTRPY